MKKNNVMHKSNLVKDTLFAKIAFYLSLGFWVPLFNIALCVASLIIAIPLIKRIREEPEKFGGLNYVIFAIIISLLGIIATIIGLIVYLQSQTFCLSAYCSNIINS
jgi:uncharacterized membrane protein